MSLGTLGNLPPSVGQIAKMPDASRHSVSHFSLHPLNTDPLTRLTGQE